MQSLSSITMEYLITQGKVKKKSIFPEIANMAEISKYTYIFVFDIGLLFTHFWGSFVDLNLIQEDHQ